LVGHHPKSGLSKQEVVELAAKQDGDGLKEAVKERLAKGKKPKQSKQSQAKTKARPVLTLPNDPVELARALLDKLGLERARKLYNSLGDLLDNGILQAPEGAQAITPQPESTTRPFTIWKVGRVVSAKKLEGQFGLHYWDVLGECLDVEPKKKGPPSFKVIKEMPKTAAEYQDLQQKRYTTTVEALINDAFSQIEELTKEMQDAYLTMDENLQASDLGVRRRIAAEGLELLVIDKPVIPGSASKIEAFFLPAASLSSKSKRAVNAAAMLRAAGVSIRSSLENHKEDQSEMDKLACRLDILSDRAECVNFGGVES